MTSSPAPIAYASPRTLNTSGSPCSSAFTRQLVRRERDLQPRAVPVQRVRQLRPVRGQPRVERQLAEVVAHAAEAADQRRPDAAGRGDVHAVGGVVVEVGEVDEDRLPEVLQRQVLVAHLRREDRLHDGRQRRVARGQRVVVLEVGELVLGREVVALQEQREHDVGLLEHLVAVDHERVEVQQQRPLVGRGVLEVPHLALEEHLVLRMDAEGRAERDVQRLGGPIPRLGLAGVEVQAVDHRAVGLGVVLGHLADGARGEAEVEAGHDVREQVVVDDRGVLVRPGDAVDVERVLAVAVARAPEAERVPQPRGLDGDVDALAVEELDIPRRPHVLREREAHVGVDVVLRGARRVVRRCLFAVDRPPGEERAGLVELARATPGRRQHEVPHPQRVARPERGRVGEERQDVDLGVPEVVAAVARSRSRPSRGRPGRRRARRPARAGRGTTAPPAGCRRVRRCAHPSAPRTRRTRRAAARTGTPTPSTSARSRVRRQRSTSSRAGTPREEW